MSTIQARSGASPSTPSGVTTSRSTDKRGAGSYTRLGFSPVLSEDRWICSRATRPISRITESSKTCYHGATSMKITLGWARCADNVADILRRGAWYPIVEESADGYVVVDVRQQRVRLSRSDVEVRTEPPDHWSIVTRTGVLRPTLGGKGMEVVTTYAVCPR